MKLLADGCERVGAWRLRWTPQHERLLLSRVGLGSEGLKMIVSLTGPGCGEDNLAKPCFGSSRPPTLRSQRETATVSIHRETSKRTGHRFGGARMAHVQRAKKTLSLVLDTDSQGMHSFSDLAPTNLQDCRMRHA